MKPRVIYSNRAEAFREVCSAPEIYLAPKERLVVLQKCVPCKVTAVEDIDKTDTWLWLNEAVQRGTPIIYERVARYYKMTSDKARKLSRLADVSGNVSIVDIVPFCEDIKMLYMTWRYIDRAILGHAHFYAFAGGHAEMFGDQIVGSLDSLLLAHKIRPHSITERSMPSTQRETVNLSFTEAEHQTYLSKREALFASNRTPQPILTRLADTSHAFATRRTSVNQLTRRFRRPAVICNMADFANEYRDSAASGTYSKPPKNLHECDGVIFAEPPIVHSYRRFDIESELNDGATVIDVVGNTKVDAFLCGRTRDEVTSVISFMDKLRSAVK